VVMVAYNMMNQSAEQTVFPLCREKDVGTMGIFTVRNVFSIARRLEEVVAELKGKGLLAEEALPYEDALGWLLDDDDPSLVAAAYRFSAGNDAISTIMCGTIDIDHLDANIRALEKGPLAPDKQARLRQLFGHLKDPIGN